MKITLASAREASYITLKRVRGEGSTIHSTIILTLRLMNLARKGLTDLANESR
nr:hypothetical protein Q903MT_gene2450 [Picea sitchensis]